MPACPMSIEQRLDDLETVKFRILNSLSEMNREIRMLKTHTRPRDRELIEKGVELGIMYAKREISAREKIERVNAILRGLE